MASRHWPLAGLRVRTPRLELRTPTPGDLDELADLAVSGIHDPAVQPFTAAWTDIPAAERAQATLQYHWAQLATWKPVNWGLELVAALGGTVVGMQGMHGRDYAILREVSTGSWLGRQYQRRGVGTEMRAAVLHLAFAGLGAQYAISAAHDDNPASLRVSRKLGYQEDGIERYVVRGRPQVAIRLRLSRDAWETHRTVPVELAGLAPCLPYFGLRPAA